jgi:hypothetical protein
MHTKPLIDFVISEGIPISRLSNTPLSNYQFTDKVGGLFADFFAAVLLNKLVQSPVIQWHTGKENFLHLDLFRVLVRIIVHRLEFVKDVWGI